MKKFPILPAATILMLIGALDGRVGAQVFDVEAGYTDSVSPVAGSPWTYGDKASPLGTATIQFDTPYTYPAAPPNGIEGLGDYDDSPSVEAGNDSRVQVNPANSAYLNFPAYTFSLEGDDTGAAHPDPFVRFTASNSVPGSVGTFDLSLSFQDLAANGSTVDYLVYTPFLTGTPVALFTAPSASLSYTAPITLLAGDTLDVVQTGDSVIKINETLTTVPEPSTWAMLMIAALGLAGWRARRVA